MFAVSLLCIYGESTDHQLGECGFRVIKEPQLIQRPGSATELNTVSEPSQTDFAAIGMFIVLLGAYVLMAADRYLFPVLAPDVRREFSFPLANTGLLSTIFALGLAIGGLPTGYLLLIAVAGLFLQRGFVPGWRTLNTDFPDYYLAARLYRDGYSLDRVYEWQWLQRQKNRLGLDQALVGYAPNPPLCFTAVLPFAGLPALAAKRCWLVFNLFLLAGVITLLRSMTRLHWRHIAVLVLLAVVPLGNNFVLGQMYVLIQTNPPTMTRVSNSAAAPQ